MFIITFVSIFVTLYREVYDFNNDGLGDIAFLFSNNSNGSGIFYYITTAINTENGYIGTNSILLGDRISPQTTEFRNEEIIVNYADRKIDEPMTAKSSIGISKYFKIIDKKLIEIKIVASGCFTPFESLQSHYN